MFISLTKPQITLMTVLQYCRSENLCLCCHLFDIKRDYDNDTPYNEKATTTKEYKTRKGKRFMGPSCDRCILCSGFIWLTLQEDI